MPESPTRANSAQTVIRQMLAASTPTEIEEAREAQRRWVRSHPEDRLLLGQAGEQLTMIERAERGKRGQGEA